MPPSPGASLSPANGRFKLPKTVVISMAINEELLQNEKIEMTLKPSRFASFMLYLAGGILTITIVGALIGIPVLIIAEVLRRATNYHITNKRIISEFSLLGRKTSSVAYDKIQDVHFSQGLIDKFFKVGTININTSGSNLIELQLKGIENALTVKKTIEEHMMK